jgi:hypothetical protein
MNRILLLFGLILFNNFCFADFVDIATVEVNGKMIRKLTRNNGAPYLICLSNFKPGDTLTIDVWTDYGGQYNSHLIYQNKLTQETDSIHRLSKIILTKEMIEIPHLFAVNFIQKYKGENIKNTWEIFETTNNARIEQCYDQLNQFVESLKANFSNEHDFFLDSIECNIAQANTDENGRREKLQEIVMISQKEFPKLINLTEEEEEYLKDFNAKDYVQLYNTYTRMYGQLVIDSENLQWVQLKIVSFKGARLIFEFEFQGDKLKLKSVTV